MTKQEYFRNTALKDSNGNLLTCYHWTKNTFDAFSYDRIGDESGDGGYFGRGFYFTGRSRFNSCCFNDDGRQPFKLAVHLKIVNPLHVDSLEDYGYGSKEDLLTYFKENSDSWATEKIMLDMEQDFLAFVHANPSDYEDREELIRAFEDGEVDWYEHVDGVSMGNMFDWAEAEGKVLTIRQLDFRHLHRGDWEEFGALLTDWAKDHGYDGITSCIPEDCSEGPVEIVCFYPNQIKLTSNENPTDDPRMNA